MVVTCPETGAPAPLSTTLMASKTDPAKEAWVVSPKCVVTKIPLVAAGPWFDAENQDIQRVVSLPTDVEVISLRDNMLTDGADFTSATKLQSLRLTRISTKVLDTLAFPSSLVTLSISSSSFTSIGNLKLPAKLKSLTLTGSQLTTLKDAKFPAGLTSLDVGNNKLLTMDAILPDSLEKLEMDQNVISAFEKITFPSSLISFSCYSCQTSVVRGIKWPKKLRFLNFGENPITMLEFRQSDFELLTKGAFVEIASESCTTPTAKLETLQSTGKKVCVVSDKQFDDVYVRNIIPTTTTTPPKPSSGNSSGSGIGSATTPAPTATTTQSSSSNGSDLATMSSSAGDATAVRPPISEPNTDAGLPTFGPGTSQVPSGPGSQVPSGTTVTTMSSSNGNTLTILAAGVGALFVVVLAAVLVYRAAKKRREKTNANDGDIYRGVSCLPGILPVTAITDGDRSAADEKAIDPAPLQADTQNDIRFDPVLAKFRIGRNEIQVGEPVARGGFGVIYKGHYDGRDVAIKQMLPGTWRDDAMRASFMDEIRLCASLEHAKVVEFIGISWSSLRDLAVVIEFMAGGDLFTLLHAQRERSPPPSPLDWSQPWTPSQIKSKTSIALDVAEAVVYLHSYNSPILHRDLKANNVLLDLKGNAKLSDFGISRELSVDETMTREIGTAAWIAPEVLRGERYSEKADIYSLGVLLVELDCCQHPYAEERVLQLDQQVTKTGAGGGAAARRPRGSMSQVAHKNTQIAVLVSTGKLRPRVSPDCPHIVASLVARCLLFDPADRPTAMEVFYEFRQLNKKWSKLV